MKRTTNPAHRRAAERSTAAAFIETAFAPKDRLALVLVLRQTRRVIQRIVSAQTLATMRWQRWLRFKNAHGHDVYASINALRPNARRRTKPNIGVVRHLFLDVDHNADLVVARLNTERLFPLAHYVLRSSRDHCQLWWRVRGLSVADAERWQRTLARYYDADLAATDASRVARLPGFRNCKYSTGEWVCVLTHRALAPYDATALPDLKRFSITRSHASMRGSVPYRTGRSQSERDWQWAIAQLATGHTLGQVETILAARRRIKHQPLDYAARTVDAAWVHLALRTGRPVSHVIAELAARRHARPAPDTYASHVVSRAESRMGDHKSSRGQHGDRHRS